MYYENFEKLCVLNDVRPGTVSKATGISTATLTSWKQGKYTPKQDKLQLIADYFNVSVDYLMTGEAKEGGEPKMKPGVNFINENGDIRSFDMTSIIYSICEAVSKMPPEQQELVNNMVGGKKKKIIYVENPQNKKKPLKEIQPHLRPNAAHSRTDIELPKDTDTSDNDIMDDENF